MKPITFTLAPKKLLLLGISALAIFAALVAWLVITTGTLSDVKKELSDVKKELAVKVGKRELADLLAKHDIKGGQLPNIENQLREEKPKYTEPYEQVIVAYLTAKTWQDRLPFVLHPKTTEPRMKRHYGYDKLGEAKAIDVTRKVPQGEVDVGKYIGLWVDYEYQRYGTKRHYQDFYYVKRTRDGYKVDWEASHGKNSMTWKAYLAQKPTKPMLFRVTASLDDYYNYEFMNAQDTYLSINLTNNELPVIVGYVRKGTKTGKRMYEILKDGESHPLIVKIRFLAHGDAGRNTVLIDELVSEDWRIAESKEFAE